MDPGGDVKMMESLKHEGDVHTFSLSRHLRSRFVSGLFVLVPLAVTIFVLKLVLSTLEAAAMPFVRPLLKTAPQFVLVVMAVVFMVAFIYLIGQIASHIVGQRLIRWPWALSPAPCWIQKAIYAIAYSYRPHPTRHPDFCLYCRKSKSPLQTFR